MIKRKRAKFQTQTLTNIQKNKFLVDLAQRKIKLFKEKKHASNEHYHLWCEWRIPKSKKTYQNTSHADGSQKGGKKEDSYQSRVSLSLFVNING